MGTRHLGTVDTGPRLLDLAATVPLRGKSCEGGGENLFMCDLGREPVYSRYRDQGVTGKIAVIIC